MWDGLEELALGEVADEVEVGGEEVEGGELAERGPLEGVEDVVIEIAGEGVDDEELQVDGAAVAVAVADLGDAAVDDSLDAELLVELAGEGLLGGLSGLDLAAGELPFEAHGLVRAALADEDFGDGAGVAGDGAEDQRRDHQPKRLAACVGVCVQFANTLFHAGVCLSCFESSILKRLNFYSLDAFHGGFT